MKDFKNFSNEGKNDKTGAEDNLINVLNKTLNGKNGGNLLQTIIAQAEEAKKNGTLTNADLDNFYTNLAPLLDAFKRAKLKQVINKLKAL